jgi:hypothetical protein
LSSFNANYCSGSSPIDLLEKFAPKKKKPLSVNQCGEKGKGGALHTCRKKAMRVGGDYHTRRLENFRTISSEKKKKKPWY